MCGLAEALDKRVWRVFLGHLRPARISNRAGSRPIHYQRCPTRRTKHDFNRGVCNDGRSGDAQVMMLILTIMLVLMGVAYAAMLVGMHGAHGMPQVVDDSR